MEENKKVIHKRTLIAGGVLIFLFFIGIIFMIIQPEGDKIDIKKETIVIENKNESSQKDKEESIGILQEPFINDIPLWMWIAGGLVVYWFTQGGRGRW